MSRIIAGSARGAQLRVPPGDRTRPTTDRVREALFSALATWAGGADESTDQQLAGIALLDLYAGSGAIGLEALSRGARRVVLVENQRTVAELIKRNAQQTRLADRAEVRTGTVNSYLAGDPERFDVVWLDPPYGIATEQVDAALARIAEGWLADDGLVVVERSRRDPAPRWPDLFPDQWSRRYGETELYFGRPATEPSEGNQ